MTVDDVVVTGRSWIRLSWGVGGTTLAGLGVFLVIVGLDDADKLASVIGVFVGLAGLGVSVYGAVLARRAPTGPGPHGLVSARDGGVRQQVDAGGDAFIAGRDQHFGERRPR